MSGRKAAKPPYGAYKAFWSFILALSEHPLPQYIEDSAMGNRSGTSKSELYAALRFFELIDSERCPTAKLRSLCENPTTDKMRDLIQLHYRPVLDLRLETATPSQVDVALQSMGTTKGTIPKARAFFIHGAQDVDIPLGRSLVSGRPPAATRRRRGVRSVRGGGREEISPRMRVMPAREKALHPLIEGLIEDLPSEGNTWEASRASQWLDLARPALAYVYKFEYPPR
jgi:hypothetical protein